MSKDELDNSLMRDGIGNLLNKSWDSVPAPPSCQHRSDGTVYDDSTLFHTLRCYDCGAYYDKPKTE